MEVSALRHRSALRGPTPFLRLQSDERLVALTRRGNETAYEVLVARYQARLLAFCRHMLASKEDAEDVLQEVFAAAYSAMLGDDRTINVRPWLYRIARNRSLNHLRKQTAIGVDSMDVHLADHGTSTADRVHKREEFRQLVGDVQELPETQRTALLLREIDALSYEQIAQAMETTVPAIKSLLVRARVSLAEAAEARALSCEEVRAELGEVAEGLRSKTPPVRRHVRTCERCKGFEKSLSQTNRALAAVFPVGPLLLVKKFLLAQGASSAAGAASAATTTVGASAASAGSGAFGAGLATIATKTAAVVAGAAIVTAGAVEVDHSQRTTGHRARTAAAAASAPAAGAAQAGATSAAPRVVASTPQPVQAGAATVKLKPATKSQLRDTPVKHLKKKRVAAVPVPAGAAGATGATGASGATGRPVATPITVKPTKPVDTGSDVTSLPSASGSTPQHTSSIVVPNPEPAPQSAPAESPPPSSPPADSSPPPAAASPQPAPSSDPTSPPAAPAPQPAPVSPQALVAPAPAPAPAATTTTAAPTPVPAPVPPAGG